MPSVATVKLTLREQAGTAMRLSHWARGFRSGRVCDRGKATSGRRCYDNGGSWATKGIVEIVGLFVGGDETLELLEPIEWV